MSARPILYPYFNDTAQVLLSEYQRSSQQEASANLGRNREFFCSEFLAKVLPQKLSVEKGEVWDSHGNRTGQLDVIVVRDDCPCLHIGSDNIYLAEGIFAVIEVKSNLTTAKLQESWASLTRVENLSFESGAMITSGAVLNRPLRVVFSYQGATLETLMDYVIANSIADTFDIICVLERGIAFKNRLLISTNTPHQFFLQSGKAAALGFLFLHLLSFASSFVGRSLRINGYFEPLSSWGETQ